MQIALNADDVREIKLKTDLATKKEDSYIAIGYGSFVDMSGNKVKSVSSALVASYFKDITPPNLLRYNFDLNTGRMSLTFDDVVLRSSFDPTGLTLQNSRLGNDSFNKYTLTGGSSPSDNGYVIELILAKIDFDEIKRRDGLARSCSKETTYVTLRSELIEDVAAVPVTSIVSDRGLQVSNCTPDTTRPHVVDFSVDLTKEIIHLRFSETVNILKLKLSEITIQNEKNYTSSTVAFSLTGGRPDPDVAAVEFSVYLTQGKSKCDQSVNESWNERQQHVPCNSVDGY